MSATPHPCEHLTVSASDSATDSSTAEFMTSNLKTVRHMAGSFLSHVYVLCTFFCAEMSIQIAHLLFNYIVFLLDFTLLLYVLDSIPFSHTCFIRFWLSLWLLLIFSNSSLHKAEMVNEVLLDVFLFSMILLILWLKAQLN